MATIEKLKSGGWRARVRRDGQDHSATFDSQGEASQWASEVERLMVGGGHIAKIAAEQISLHSALVRYQDEILPLKKGGDIEKYRVARLKKHPLSARPLSSLRGADFAGYRNERLKEGASPGTVRLELALVSHLFTTCIREWGLEGLSNPIAALKLPRPSKGRERRLSPSEEAALYAVAPGVHALLLPVMKFALESAMRRGEIVTLQWPDVNLAHRTLLVRDPKNGETRSVPLSTKAVAVLESIWEPEGPVFPVADAGVVSRAFAEARKLAGLENLRFHDLRHEATSRLFESGRFNVVEISMITGHKDLQMLKRYTHLGARQLAEKMD